MKALRSMTRLPRGLFLSAGFVAILAAVGCQVNPAGTTIPSGSYAKGETQYSPPGSEFKLSREAAAQKQYADEQARRGQQAQLGGGLQSAGAAQIGGPSPYAAQAQYKYNQQSPTGDR